MKKHEHHKHCMACEKKIRLDNSGHIHITESGEPIMYCEHRPKDVIATTRIIHYTKHI